jgi:hypothetical protein
LPILLRPVASVPIVRRNRDDVVCEAALLLLASAADGVTPKDEFTPGALSGAEPSGG